MATIEGLNYYAWHFLRADMTARSGHEKPWEVGELRTIDGVLKLCEWGYHSSPTPRDALYYRTGLVLCRVRCSASFESDGDERSYNRKSVHRSRKLIACANVVDTIRLFAVDCADQALPIFEKRRPKDKRVRRCLEVTRRYLKGDATIDELRNAQSAAAAAAAAADDADAAAAYAAAAYAAADDADADADAAYAYAADAATAAADDAERKWQAEHFEELLKSAHPHLFIGGIYDGN